jgi:hypothetical protein
MAERGFLNHIWYKLLNEEGVPVSGAEVYIYALNLSPLIIYESDGLTEITQPIITTSGGVFEFYVQDDIGVPSGATGHYSWETEYIISWNDGLGQSGIIQGDALFGRYAQVDETDSSSTRVNKSMSNYLGWFIQDHIDFMFGTTQNCGSSSSSSSSQSSSSSSSLSSTSSCTQQFEDTLYPVNYTANSGVFQVENSLSFTGWEVSGTGEINLDVSDLTGFDVRPHSMRFGVIIANDSAFTSFVIKNTNGDIVFSEAYDTGHFNTPALFTITDLNWNGYDFANVTMQVNDSVELLVLQLFNDCGSSSSYSSSSSSSSSVSSQLL